MTYDEAFMPDEMVAKSRVTREILDHECDPREFFAEYGIRAFYQTSTVLAWLGY